MATDDACHAAKAAEFCKNLDALVAAAYNMKKSYDAACARVLAATPLLEEEQCAAAVLTEEAHTAAVLIEPPSPTQPSVPAAAPSDDNYEATVIANVHVQATDV
jgi:hypothetical protein